MSECRYYIDGVTYIQRALVFGQIKQLAGLLGGVTIDMDNGAEGLLDLFGDKMPQALAIVLTPEGVRVKDKDLIQLADDLEFAITAEQVVQVIDDFFTCNPVVSLLNRLSQTSGVIKDLVVNWVTGLINSYASLQPETSPDGMTSCGDTALTNAGTGLTTGDGKSDSVSLSSACSADLKKPVESPEQETGGTINALGNTAGEKT